MASALDGYRQLALVSGAGTGLAPWTDFAIFGDEAAKHIDLFVIDADILVCAELADFGTSNEAAWAGTLLCF